MQRSSYSSAYRERTRCPSYFSRDFSQRANERSEFLFIPLLSPPLLLPPPSSRNPRFPLLPFFGLHFLRREWENRLNISEHTSGSVVTIVSTYLSPLVSYFVSLLVERSGETTYHNTTAFKQLMSLNRLMQSVSLVAKSNRSDFQ